MIRWRYTHWSQTKAAHAELHTFTDASQRAYRAVSYLRSIDEEGRVSVAFIYGKSSLAPVKQQSIPRLELCAAKLAVEMAVVISQELETKCERSVLWTDIMLILQYIDNPSRRFRTYSQPSRCHTSNIKDGSVEARGVVIKV